MGHTDTTIDAAVSACEELADAIRREMDKSIYWSSARDMLDGDTVPKVDTQSDDPESVYAGHLQLFMTSWPRGGQMWLGKVWDAAQAVRDADSKLMDKQADNNASPSPFDQQRIHKTTQLLGRLEAFVLAVQRELCGTFRTQQSIMHNPNHNAEVDAAFDQSISEMIDWLYRKNDIED